MARITKDQLLESMSKIYEQTKDCGLEPSIFENLKPELGVLSAYFNTSESQSFFIAYVLVVLLYKNYSHPNHRFLCENALSFKPNL